MRKHRVNNAHVEPDDNPGAPFVLPPTPISPEIARLDNEHAHAFGRWATHICLIPVLVLVCGVATIFVLKFLQILWSIL